MQNERISVVFNVPGDENGVPSSTELGEALIAIEKTFSQAYSLLYPNLGELRVSPSATRAGCFEIDLILGLLRNNVEFEILSSGSVQGISTVLDSILGDRGAIRALKWLRNRVAQFTYNADDTVKMSTDDGDFEASGKTVKLIQNKEWRDGLSDISKAISGDRSETTISDNRNKPIVIVRSDQEDFSPPEADDDVDDQDVAKHRATLTIVAPSFEPEVDWWLRNHKFGLQQYAMHDLEFQQRARTEMRFSGHDQIQCSMTITDRGPGRRPRKKYAILDVTEYIPATQGTLFDT